MGGTWLSFIENSDGLSQTTLLKGDVWALTALFSMVIVVAYGGEIGRSIDLGKHCIYLRDDTQRKKREKSIANSVPRMSKPENNAILACEK